MTDLLLYNANVITLEPDRPHAQVVAISQGRIVSIGDATDFLRLKGPSTKAIDCQGMTLVPGFIDAHCHLLALASSLMGVDCGPHKVASISQLMETISRRAQETPPGLWIRAYGYDDVLLQEKRHPNRWELDSAAPYHPVRLEHRTGHACVLNSRALSLAGITVDTADPTAGVIVRDEARGEPTGLLLEMHHCLKEHLGGERDDGLFLEGVRRANELLLSVGVTSVQDAGPANDYQRWQTFKRLKKEGHIKPRVSVMLGADRLGQAREQGVVPGLGNEDLNVSGVKLMLTLTTGALQPPLDELQEIVLKLHREGFQLAVHAVEEEVVEVAVEAIAQARRTFPTPDSRHRIEHCSECPPLLADRLKEFGVVVVTQPGFVYWNGVRYLSEVHEETLPHLYPLATFLRKGIPLAAGSDAPVSSPSPLLSIYAAVTRRTSGASILSPGQGIPVIEALKMHTIGGAYAAFQEGLKGSVGVGKVADMVLLNQDPTSIDPQGIKDIEVLMTVLGGRVAWER